MKEQDIMITVIHTRDADFTDPHTVYCGREYTRGKYYLPRSVLCNNYRIGASVTTRLEAIRRFEEDLERKLAAYRFYQPRETLWIIRELDRLDRLSRTGDLKLACWCAPKPCHCDVIKAKLHDW